MLLSNAMFKTISDLVIGTNISVQAILTYVYGFFEGALVMLTIFVVGFTVLGGGIQLLALYFGITAAILITNPFTAAASPPVMASVPIMTAIAFTFYTLVFAFLCIFIVVVVIMLMYAEFLKAVFNIDVQARKSPFPDSPL